MSKIMTTAKEWLPTNLVALNQRFEKASPLEILRWSLTTYQDEIAIAVGFGPSGLVVMDMVAKIRPKTTFFYLETDLLFPETYQLRNQLIAKYDIKLVPVHSGLSLNEQNYQYGDNLWVRSPDLCCHLRKVEPLQSYLAHKRAWVTAVRRDQGPSRAKTPIIAWDATNQVVKVCPMVNWTKKEVWSYLLENEIPYNVLHDRGYNSVGCLPCTRAVDGSADERAGRWAGSGKVECGIHLSPEESKIPSAAATSI